VGMLYVNLSHAPKKPPASAARIQSPQQNECVTTATLDYNKIKLERFVQLQQNPSPTAILSVEKTIEERRLQEQYCQRFARCLFDPGGNEVAALSYATAPSIPVCVTRPLSTMTRCRARTRTRTRIMTRAGR